MALSEFFRLSPNEQQIAIRCSSEHALSKRSNSKVDRELSKGRIKMKKAISRY
jgi:hypothetical protein